MKTRGARSLKRLIFDLGSHIGEDLEYYLGKGNRVVAVEANPDCAQVIRRKFKRELKSAQLVLVEAAVWRLTGRKIPFFVNSERSIWGTTRIAWVNRNQKLGTRSRRIVVGTVSIQHLIQRYGVPHYIKIDLEGYDLEVLRQLSAYSSSHPDFTECRYISWESSKTSLGALVEEFDLAQSMGFRKFAVIPQDTLSEKRGTNIMKNGKRKFHHWPASSSGPFGSKLSEPYLGRTQALDRYQTIFFNYQLYGDRSLLFSLFEKSLAEKLTGSIKKRFGSAGWYDTHARR